jgi:MFS family permease
MLRDKRVFIAACLGMLLFGIVFLSLGSAVNMLAERFGLDDAAIGTLTVLLPAGILAGSLVFGPIADRFGYRWMLVVASLMVGVGLEGLAFATSKPLVQGLVFLIGLSGGVLNGATNALAAEVSEGQRGARLSLLGVFFGIGALAMPTTLAILSRHFALSTVVAGIGALVIIPAAYCLAIEFPPPKQRAGRASLLNGFRLLRDPIVLFAGVALAVQSGMEGMSNDWMARFFRNVTLTPTSSAAGFVAADRLPLAEWKMQLGLAALTLGMMLARLALSRLLKLVDSRTVLLGSVAVTAFGVTLLRTAPGYGPALAGALLVGAGLAAGFPVVFSYIGDVHPQDCGAAFSAILVLALLGNMAINKTLGYVAQRFGVQHYASMMYACLAVSAILLFVVVRLRETDKAVR